MRPVLVFAAAVLWLALPGRDPAAAPRRVRDIDHFQVHPDLRSIRLTAIAMLPAVSFDGVTPAERSAESEWMKLIHDSGYRWITATTARDMLRRSGGDSLLKVMKEEVLARDRPDSVLVPGWCAVLRVNGLIMVRVDRAEQVSIQSDQSGRPSTTVQVRAVLVDSLGRLVWSASGSQFAEGLEFQSCVAGAVGGGTTGLSPTAVQVRSNAPGWPMALTPMFLRWLTTFPRRDVMAGGAAADSSAH